MFQDICGIICAILTWALIIYAEFVVMAVILLPNINTLYSGLNMAIFQTLAFLAFASHLRTMFTDPVRKEKLPHNIRLTLFCNNFFNNSNQKKILSRAPFQKETLRRR